jgi:hypothetical protein
MQKLQEKETVQNDVIPTIVTPVLSGKKAFYEMGGGGKMRVAAFFVHAEKTINHEKHERHEKITVILREVAEFMNYLTRRRGERGEGKPLPLQGEGRDGDGFYGFCVLRLRAG